MRAATSSFTLSWGPATTSGRLVPVQASPSKPKFKLVTPDGKIPTQVYQTDDGEVYKRGDLVKGIVHKNGAVDVYNPEDIDDAKDSGLPKNTMLANAHRTSDVVDYLFPADGKSFIMEPVLLDGKRNPIKNPVNTKWYDFITTIVRDMPELTFLGLAAFGNNSEALYKLSIYQGNLLLQRMTFYEDLNQFEIGESELSPVEEKKARAIANKLVSDFDINNYRDKGRERLKEALANGFQEQEDQNKTDDEFDLESVLDAWE